MTIKANGKDWKALLESAKVYVDEATVKVGGGKARVMAVTTTKENMFFGEIDCEGEAEFSVSLEKMIKAMSAVGENPDIDMGDGVLIVYGQSAKVKVPLIVCDTCPNWPERFVKATAYCDISPSQLEPMLSYGKFCNQTFVRIFIGDTKMRMEIGSEYGTDTSEIESLSTAVGESKSTFGLDLINTLIKHIKSCDAVTVGGFGDDVPMSFAWADGTGRFKVLIAPRLEE